MSTRRRSTIEQNEKALGHLRGPNGHRLCRFCKKEVHPPRKTFCSDECVHEWKLRSDASYMREHVYKRDRGICAGCRTDTRHQKIRIEDTLHECGGNIKDVRFVTVLRELNLTAHESQKSLWQADHKVPVDFGGGECGLGNLQTLCTKCHKMKTGRQASRGAKVRPLKQTKVLMLKAIDPIKPFSTKFK